MSTTVEVGTRFTKTASRRYRDNAGTRHTHTYTIKCQVTAVNKDSLSWELLAVLSETDRPADAAFLPEKGTIAWFGWEAALHRKDVAILTTEAN